MHWILQFATLRKISDIPSNKLALLIRGGHQLEFLEL